MKITNPLRRARNLRRPSRGQRGTPRVEQLENRRMLSVSSLFELDGNAITGVLGTSGSTTTSHDWDQVFADSVGGTSTSGALASSFVTDRVNSTQDDIFTGGGSKDVLGIQQGRWLFTDSKPQPKDDITHAYAAAYTDPANGHLVLYAGLDRFDNSGAATAGFWFFKNSISENPAVTTNGGHPFVGAHRNGDILLVSDFTVGGSVSTIKVFRWTGDDATGSLVPVSTGNPADGNTFAIVNGGPITVPWSYINKSGTNQPAAGEFLEEGIDLTALGIQGCFSSFLAETRSSQSPTATLSDFVLGQFPLCSMAATPFTGLSKVGDSVTYPLTVTNTGAVPLFIQNVSDTLLGTIVSGHALKQPGDAGVNPAVTGIDAGGFNFSQPLASGASLTINVTRTVQAGDSDPTVSTVTFTGTGDLAGLDDPVTASATNTVNLFQPSATLSLSASPTTIQHLGDPVTYTYTITNTSSTDSPNLVLDVNDPNNSFTDSLLGDLEADAVAAGGGSLSPGGTFTFTKTRAIQAGDPSPLTNTAGVVFTLAQNLGSFDNLINAGASTSVILLPELTITKAATGGVTVINPGDTASFTITVSNTGAGPATNVLVTDQLPEGTLLDWTVGSSSFDTATISAGDFLTAIESSLPAGASVTITVNALIPADLFGGTGSGNGNPIPGGLFELDGNAVDDPNVAGDDWSNVLLGNGGSALASSFVTDAVNSRSDDIFTGGGSKDVHGIQQGPWLSANSKPQAKDDITHAYAAMYTHAASGDVILFAGLDRFDNSGAATAGFWFLQDGVSENLAVTQNGGHPFIGTHTDGDILLVSDFTIGGSVSTIKVFRWTGDDATGGLVAVPTPPNSTFAIVNGGPISVPWSFTDKSRNSGPAAGEFLEEGVNLTALGLGGCFSSFLAETRSSQSPTATLSDFVIGNFDTCRLDLPNTATVQADGIAPITSNQVIITILPADATLASLDADDARGSIAGLFSTTEILA
jgi:uncharacterized repeat protein (TIGR01451 family)